jgi:hypothetical protein
MKGKGSNGDEYKRQTGEEGEAVAKEKRTSRRHPTRVDVAW